MFQSDLEMELIVKEQHRRRLQDTEAIRAALQQRQSRSRTRFRTWLGSQLIVLGQKIKGGMN